MLRDVLKAAGAPDARHGGRAVKVFALDGYGAEIPMAEIDKYPILLAFKADGRWLGSAAAARPGWSIRASAIPS
ncbi:MAG TPA: hypothetical protein VF194_03760 [Ferrovibrio sp.]|uniref:hypothetical protein n=1 Tax=Ferrovibrio sp. TaxID=1917215 RepID=UPI002ED13937